ncbi:hypothetical protein CJ030_MR2G028498 [Morella rubra]|uniref:Uncharacterized protein n=1 Tax=Morella rubra TaxID=262757 RepID=A0A6A1WP27_9ROSI|nr:hypothetical protein CJ030_MR2G028498 [Morella rubra]
MTVLKAVLDFVLQRTEVKEERRRGLGLQFSRKTRARRLKSDMGDSEESQYLGAALAKELELHSSLNGFVKRQ